MPSISATLRDKIKAQQGRIFETHMTHMKESYVAASARVIDSQQSSQDLSTLVHQFLTNPLEDNLLITGSSGAGKTFFGLTFTQRLWENYVDGQPIPLWISLLSIENPSFHLLRKHFHYNLGLSPPEIQEIFESRIPLFIILDGYDELNIDINLHKPNYFDTLPSGSKIITTCRYEALKLIDENYQRLFKTEKQTLNTLEILPFDNRLEEDAPIGGYIKKFLQHPPKDIKLPEPPWTVETYLDYLKRLPEIHELISNPYILGRVIEELPAIIKECGSELSSTKRLVLTRYRLYEVFTQKWFERQAEKYRRAGHPASQLEGKYKDKMGKTSTLEELFANYTRGLAKAMFHRRMNVVEYHLLPEQIKPAGSLASAPVSPPNWTAKYLGDELNPDLPLLRAGCPLIRLGPRRYTFLHKSLAEFFAAQHLFKGALVHAQIMSGRNLNYGNLQLEPQVLAHLVDQAKTDPAFEQALWGIIDLSKSEPTVWRAAANAATIIARTKYFIGANLRRARLGGEEGNEKWGADLSYTWLDDADAREADLRYCNLEGASIAGLKLQDACLDGIKFGELPYFEGDSFCYSPDGKYIALADKKENDYLLFSSDENTLAVYLFDSHKLVNTWSFSDRIECANISPNNKQVAIFINKPIVNDFCQLLVLDIDTGHFKHRIRHSSTMFINFIWCCDGSIVGAVEADYQTILVWNEHSNEFNHHVFKNGEKHQHQYPNYRVKTFVKVKCISNNMNFHPNGLQIAIGNNAGKIYLKNSSRRKDILENGPRESIEVLVYHPQGYLLATGSFAGNVCLWNVTTGVLLRVFKAHTQRVSMLAFNPNGTQLASGSIHEDTVYLWKIPTCELEGRLIGNAHGYGVQRLTYHPKQPVLTIMSDRLRFWDLSLSKDVNLFNLKDISIKNYAVTSSFDGSQVACASFNNAVHIWEISSRRVICILKSQAAKIYSMAYRSDGFELATLDERKVIRVWSLQSESLKSETPVSFEVKSLQLKTYLPKTSLLILIGDGHIIFFDTEKNKFSTASSSKEYNKIALRKDSLQMITSVDQPDVEYRNRTCEIEIWDMIKGRIEKNVKLADMLYIFEITYHPIFNSIAVLCQSKDAKYFIILLELDNGQIRKKIEVMSHTYVSYSSDGTLLMIYEVSGIKNNGHIQILDPLQNSMILKIPYFITPYHVFWVKQVEQDENQAFIYSLASVDSEGIKLWQIIRRDKQLDCHFVWASYLSRQLNSRGLNLAHVTGLSEINYSLLKQCSQSTLQGEPSKVSSSVILASRNKQKHIAGGKQEVKKNNGIYTINHDRWLISLVREYAIIRGKKQLTDHVYLIIQGIDENGYTVIREIDLVLKNKQFHFFEMVGSAKIRVHEKSPWDLKEKENFLESISREIERARAEVLLGKVNARMGPTAKTGYLITGKSPRLFNIPWQNCLSFCLEMLQEADIPIEPQQKDWTSFFCAFPSDYISEPVAVNETREGCLLC